MLNDRVDQKAGLLRLTLRQLEVFVATAREGSTRAAADRVARSQSAASSALAELEATLGVELFDRVGRRLVINEHGRTLLPRAASLVESAGELEHLFQGQFVLPLRVAASMTIGEHILPPLLARWKADHPDSPVQLQIANTTGVLAAVAALGVDIGFIEGPQSHPDLVVREWISDEMVIVSSPVHPLTRDGVTRDALRRSRWALRERGSGTREAADRWLSTQLGQVQVEFELGTPEAIKSLVAASDALAFLPRHSVAAALARKELKELRSSLPAAQRKLAVVTHRERRLSVGGEAFLAYCFESAPAAQRRRRKPVAGAT